LHSNVEQKECINFTQLKKSVLGAGLWSQLPGGGGRRVTSLGPTWATQRDPVSREREERKRGRERLRETTSQVMIAHTVILATWEAEIGRNMVRGQPRKIVLGTLISKITRATWAGGVAEVVECLLYMLKVLSSNPSPTKKKKGKALNSNTSFGILMLL
jgi:hypothetical protein